ncbi:uncharacterized protein BDR25DRAFT_313685 [Lindgomyces ingoldianus]|uniref:Uncharacterized protein n=1 Tax=Lindgomyces ingoldianus TaxID=673940 RepID=A0ACB6R026_9PLEO|nr:uncharacterized protein BDR25DRAFT_313685 [Lindgomyces ingoldianus]KAF2471801.1 hypothetical protein BDR25DRAFT_313685 [Lindgomyces ingoldianus]
MDFGDVGLLKPSKRKVNHQSPAQLEILLNRSSLLRERMRTRVSRGKPLRFSPWPFVRVVRLDNGILEQGVIFADLPVSPIDRPEKSAAFKRQYSETYRRRRSGSVVLVLTRSDTLSSEAKNTFKLEAQDEERLDLIEQSILSFKNMSELKGKEIEKSKALGKKQKTSRLRSKSRRSCKTPVQLKPVVWILTLSSQEPREGA